MNTLNILTYAIYLMITFFITVRVGWICYKNGIYYIQSEINDIILAESINKLLLVGYYLFNLGYATIMIYSWKSIYNYPALIESLSSKCAYIVISLGLMHYFNITLIYFIRKINQKHNS